MRLDILSILRVHAAPTRSNASASLAWFPFKTPPWGGRRGNRPVTVHRHVEMSQK
jgi:hypothetical protein